VADVFGSAVNTMVRWRRDAIAWVRECCGAEPDAWQLDPLAAASKAPQLAIVGSKGCGKTTVLAWIILWFLSTRPLANIAATSISSDNLRDGLWKELALWIHRAPVLAATLEWQQTRIVRRTERASACQAEMALLKAKARRGPFRHHSAIAPRTAEAISRIHDQRRTRIAPQSRRLTMSGMLIFILKHRADDSRKVL
jgi:hypothetical protein